MRGLDRRLQSRLARLQLAELALALGHVEPAADHVAHVPLLVVEGCRRPRDRQHLTGAEPTKVS